MPLKQRFDRILLGAIALQLMLGLAVMGSASWVIASQSYHRPSSYFLQWQFIAVVFGLVLMVAGMHVRLKLVLNAKVGLAALAAVWLLLAVALVQPPVVHTHRWVQLGGISVQPSVLARFALIVVASSLLPRIVSEGWRGRSLGVLVGVGFGTAVLVMAGSDLGSTLLIAAVVSGMFFVAGAPRRLIAAAAAAVLAATVTLIAVSPYRLARVEGFFHPEAASEGAAWQTRQSLTALGSGGLVGRGYGAGVQKLFFLPEPHTDFVFAIAGEELGLAGAGCLMLLAATIAWRGLRIAWRQTDQTRALLALGITLAFAVQSLLHLAVCLGLVPSTGIPLPLVSYGKTDVATTLASLGLLLNLSREVTP